MPKLLQEARGGRADSRGKVRGKENVSEMALSIWQESPGRGMERCRGTWGAVMIVLLGGGKRRCREPAGEAGRREGEADILGAG